MDCLPYLDVDPYFRYGKVYGGVMAMRNVGRVVVAQEVLAEFFKRLPPGMWVASATVPWFHVCPPPIEFVFDWAGFGMVRDGGSVPLYIATLHTDGKMTFDKAKD
jgi:hypothetical protein